MGVADFPYLKYWFFGKRSVARILLKMLRNPLRATENFLELGKELVQTFSRKSRALQMEDG